MNPLERTLLAFGRLEMRIEQRWPMVSVGRETGCCAACSLREHQFALEMLDDRLSDTLGSGRAHVALARAQAALEDALTELERAA